MGLNPDMANTYFAFKKFTVQQEKCAMKVCTDSCLFGASVASDLSPDILRILDIGSGTGLLSLMLAQKTQALIEAVEIDPGAAAQTSENFRASPWPERLITHQADIRAFKPEQPYDFIISNPPFFEGDLKAGSDDSNKARHDSSLVFEELLIAADRLLDKVKGRAAILVPARRLQAFCDLALGNRLYPSEIIQIRQTTLHAPFRSMIRLHRSKQENHPSKEIAIRNESGEYTTEFSALLKDYYLDL